MLKNPFSKKFLTLSGTFTVCLVGAGQFSSLVRAADYPICDPVAAYDPDHPCRVPGINYGPAAPAAPPVVAVAQAPAAGGANQVPLPVPAQSYGYAWKNCERQDLDRATMPFDSSGNFEPGCAPDTLYTWTDPSQVQAMQWHAQSDFPGQFHPPHGHIMYFWRTPLGTFGYGAQSVRIKLKPGTKFVQITPFQRSCPLDPANDSSTVYVDSLKDVNPVLMGWNEYILCDGGPVASWSTNTPEGFREMNNEQQWVQSHQTQDYDSIYRVGAGGGYDWAQGALFGMNITDPHTDWSTDHFNQNMQSIQASLYQSSGGYIYYAPGTDQSRLGHFATSHPSYFNPITTKAP